MTDLLKSRGETQLLLTYQPGPEDLAPEEKARQDLVDAVVAFVLDGTEPPPCEVEDLVAGEDDLYGPDLEPFHPVTMDMARDALCDSSLREYEGLDYDEEITEEWRIEFGVSCLEHLVDGGLEGDQPATFAKWVHDRRSRACLVAFEVAGHSFEGVTCETVGAFRNEEELHQWYRERGYMISHDDLVGAKERVLANWQDELRIARDQFRSRLRNRPVVDLNRWRRLSNHR